MGDHGTMSKEDTIPTGFTLSISDFDNELDDTTSGVYIGDILYPYSYALKKMDPDYYRRAFHSWAENKEILI
jgi:hypothetical protein